MIDKLLYLMYRRQCKSKIRESTKIFKQIRHKTLYEQKKNGLNKSMQRSRLQNENDN